MSADEVARDTLAAAIAEQRGEAPSEEEVDELLRVGRNAPPAECGFAAVCGRPRYHGGHHGGWRGGKVAGNPVVRDFGTRAVMGEPLTQRESLVLAEYAVHGSQKGVAACLGVSLNTVRHQTSEVLVKTGSVSIGHALYVNGWVAIPDGVLRHQEPS